MKVWELCRSEMASLCKAISRFCQKCIVTGLKDRLKSKIRL